MRDRSVQFAAPAFFYLVLAFAAPLTFLFASSVWVDGRPSLVNYENYLTDAFYLGVVWNSIKLGLITSVSTLLIALPAAFAMARCRPTVQAFILALIFVPLTVTTIVKVFGWTIAFRRAGVVNQALVALGILDSPAPILFSPSALYVGVCNLFLPYMLLPLFAAVRAIDPRLPEAAATLGAGPVFRFFNVLIPLVTPGVIAGLALVFSLSIASYAGPLLLIGDRFPTMTVVIARGFLAVGNHGLGSTMAVLLIVVATGAIVGANWLGRQRRGL